MTETVAAVDLGAGSGRVILGHLADGGVRMETVARFANVPLDTPEGLRWNILVLYRAVLQGLRDALAAAPGLRGVAIDSWAVDYALMRAGSMLAAPFHYRDARTAPAVADTHAKVPFDRLYRESGLQFLPFNTVYQLAAEDRDRLAAADRMLLIPDLIGYWLTGEAVAERTNASTTALIGAGGGDWNRALMRDLSIPEELFPTLVDPGVTVGSMRATTGLDNIVLTTVGSHDTASAVVAVPSDDPDIGYISSGTWSLVGVELDRAVITAASRDANFTNEWGVDGRVRFLRNVSGLWLLDESLRVWRQSGEVDAAAVLREAATVPPAAVARFDTSDARFIPPGDIPSRIAAWCREHDLPPPRDRPATVRSILESLAADHAAALRQAAELSGKTVKAVHVLGGGCRNTLLCQLTADHTGLPVYAGPVEATALGNILVQARTAGIVSGSLEALRRMICHSIAPKVYRPRS